MEQKEREEFWAVLLENCPEGGALHWCKPALLDLHERVKALENQRSPLQRIGPSQVDFTAKLAEINAQLKASAPTPPADLWRCEGCGYERGFVNQRAPATHFRVHRGYWQHHHEVGSSWHDMQRVNQAEEKDTIPPPGFVKGMLDELEKLETYRRCYEDRDRLKRRVRELEAVQIASPPQPETAGDLLMNAQLAANQLDLDGWNMLAGVVRTAAAELRRLRERVKDQTVHLEDSWSANNSLRSKLATAQAVIEAATKYIDKYYPGWRVKGFACAFQEGALLRVLFESVIAHEAAK